MAVGQVSVMFPSLLDCLVLDGCVLVVLLEEFTGRNIWTH